MIQGPDPCASSPEGKVEYSKYLLVGEDEFLKPGLDVLKKRIIYGDIPACPTQRESCHGLAGLKNNGRLRDCGRAAREEPSSLLSVASSFHCDHLTPGF